MREAKVLWALATSLAAVTIGYAQTEDPRAEGLEIGRWTIDGGGSMFSAGGAFELSGTIGQPDAGKMSGGEGAFELTGGFWFGTPQGDCNETGCVDLVDYGDLEACLTGPDGGLPAPECNCFDIDGDNDVDLSDAARFQQTFTGA
jgi:hypothetical protein